MVQAWLLLPALLAVLSLGCGLLVDRVAGTRVPGVLLLPLGLAVIVVLARACVAADATASLATPLVVAAAVTGLAVGSGRLRQARIDRWAAGLGIGVFAAYAAPVALSGSATFAGYGILGDTAVHFVLIDRIMDAGTGLGGLEPSAYQVTLRNYFASGYPLGAHSALGAVRPLAGVDVAWAFQPFLAYIGAMLALTLMALVSTVVESRWRAALVAALVAQPALVYAFALQGSVKELATLWLVPLLAALVPGVTSGADERAEAGARGTVGPRDVIPLAVACAASVAVIGVAVLPWLGPVMLVALWRVAARRPRTVLSVAVPAAAFAACLAVLSLPTILDLGDYLRVTRKVVTAQQELGNLLQPLHNLQLFGIWLQGDYRLDPTGGGRLSDLNITHVLIGVAALAGVLGTGLLVMRRAVAPLLYVAGSIVALVYVTRAGSPWADAKALAIASPAVVLAAGLGVVALEQMGARVIAALVAVVLGGGILFSNAMAYHSVSLAPRDRLDDLVRAADVVDGHGPTLYTEFEEFAKHFLRDGRPVGASEGFAVPGFAVSLRDGGAPRFGFGTAVDQISLADLRRFRSLVVHRSPVEARPPADYRLVRAGSVYDVWRRRDGVTVTAHLPAAASCARITRLARDAARRGHTLVAAPPPAAALPLPTTALPTGWGVRGDDPSLVQTVGSGRVEVRVPAGPAGVYEVWISGSIGRRVSVRVDGRPAGSAANELSRPPGWLHTGNVRLGSGTHVITLDREGGDPSPGNGDVARALGPVALSPAAPAPLRILDPSRGRELCDRPVGWIESVAGAGS